jgi:Leucine-rich repeat (LRR) protein
MRPRALSLFLLFLILLRPFITSAQVANSQDSLALVDLYNSTNGPGWTNHTNWLTSAPIGTWYGVGEDNNGRVFSLTLTGNRLIGPLPSSLGNLSALANIQLNCNGLTGPLPVSIGNLTQLFAIDLSVNQLSGSIPASLNNLTQANFFNLQSNSFSGTLPDLSGLMPNTTLILSNNQFNFSSLDGYNGPAYVTMIPQQDIPLIVNGNTLSVAPGGLAANNYYQWFKGDTLIASIQGDSTFTVSSPGNYSVYVTTTISNISMVLKSITVANTQDSLAVVDLYNSTNGPGWTNRTNWLTSAPLDSWSGVSVRYGRVTALQLEYNNLTGTIPASIGNLTAMGTFGAINNQLSGSLPSTIGNLSALNTLALDNNQLSGNLPSSLGSLSSLLNLSLQSNQFTGNIPAGIWNMTQLGNLFLNSNQLSDTIPISIGNLSYLETLNLANNKMYGNLPSTLGSLGLINIYLSGNQFTGGIPSSIGGDPNLEVLDVSNNLLTDTIPSSLGRPFYLEQLIASNNQLTGSIPDSITNCSQLEALELNNNKLTGKIPDSIGKLSSYLVYLELENNQLNGPIPSSISQLQGLDMDSINIANNHFLFTGMQYLPATQVGLAYAPQANLPLIQSGDTLYVSAGGIPAQDTFKLYNNGILIATQIADSDFVINQQGKYNIVATSAGAPLLTLYSDTAGANLILPTSTTTATQTITGNTPTDITSGIFNLSTLTSSAGVNGLTGNVTALVTIDTAISTFQGSPYVQRHYDITPDNNAATAQATVTLYFAQQDFDAYNTYVTAHNPSIPLLPSGGVDNGNVQITQYHGQFTGTANPANYSQGSELITPIAAWDAVNNWWTVTFPVTGFSGFFLSSGGTPLALNLLNFTAQRQGQSVSLQWQTTNEINTKQFIVQRGSDNNSFTTIGTVPAKNLQSINTYSYTDANPVTGDNFYRLKMQDLSGNYSYSLTVLVSFGSSASLYQVYPNPVTNTTNVYFNANAATSYTIDVTDLSGRRMQQVTGISAQGLNSVTIDMQGYASGMYTITITDGEYEKQTLKVSKL